MIRVEGEIVQGNIEKVLHQKQCYEDSLARAYAMRTHEDQDAPRVIASIFSLYDIEMHALIDPSSTNSYVYTKCH